MSPIKRDTIRVEKWTGPAGEVKQQIVANGDTENPGVWIFIRGVLQKNRHHIKGMGNIVDVYVNREGIVEDPKVTPLGIVRGIWRQAKGRERG